MHGWHDGLASMDGRSVPAALLEALKARKSGRG